MAETIPRCYNVPRIIEATEYFRYTWLHCVYPATVFAERTVANAYHASSFGGSINGENPSFNAFHAALALMSSGMVVTYCTAL